MDPRTLELINLDLDGRLDEAAGGELAARLASDPAARAHHAQLRAVAQALAAAPAPELPGGFRDEILSRARWRQQAPARRWSGLRWGAVYALAASVAFAGIAVQLLNTASSPPSELVAGTLARSEPTVAVRPDAHGLTLDFNLPAGTPADLIVELGAPASGLTATVAGGPAPRFENGRIVVPGVTGSRLTLQIGGTISANGLQSRLVRDGQVRTVSQAGDGGSPR
jgi:hypothetical protein